MLEFLFLSSSLVPIWQKNLKYSRYFGCVCIHICLSQETSEKLNWGKKVYFSVSAWHSIREKYSFPLEKNALERSPGAKTLHYLFIATFIVEQGRFRDFSQGGREFLATKNSGNRNKKFKKKEQKHYARRGGWQN